MRLDPRRYQAPDRKIGWSLGLHFLLLRLVSRDYAAIEIWLVHIYKCKIHRFQRLGMKKM